MNRDLLAYIGKQPRLPAGYREVEYLESTGVQWIDTGQPLTERSRVEVQVSNVSGISSGDHMLFGANSTEATAGFWMEWYNSTVYVCLSHTRSYTSVQGVPSAPSYHIIQSVNDGLVINNVKYKTFTTGSFTTLNCVLFNYSSLKYPISCRIQRFIISENGCQVRHYIPCVRIADSKPGMYDLCGSVCPLTGTPFYVNAGTGADFLWGEKQPDFFPTYGMVFWNPLDKWRTKAATGQTMTYAGEASIAVLPTETTYKGIPCCQFPPDSLWYASQTFKNGRYAYAGSLSCWVASNQALVKWRGSNYIVCIRKDTSGYIRYGVDWRNDFANISAGTHDSAVSYNGYTSIPNDTNWHHYCLLTDVPETPSTSQSAGWHCVLYLDGQQVWEGTQYMPGVNLSVLMFGQFRASDSNVFSIAGIRAYNRLLHPDEILVLAHEYTPTE